MNRLQSLLREKRPLVMGILNTTPDSFSDGGLFNNVSSAVAHALQMIEQGADIIDVGGESTRPGAAPVALVDELARVIPVIEKIRQQTSVLISIDTSKVEVMRQAVAAGAGMINDVLALQMPGAVEICAQLKVPVCLMHMQGEPRSMQNNPHYSDVVTEVKTFLEERAAVCLQAGIAGENIVVDPGFGFGKTLQHNLLLLKHLDQLTAMPYPVLAGVSRKSMIGKILNVESHDRLHGSLAAAVLACSKGARILRVHDVKPTVDALRVCHAVSTIH
ncbi:MAG TPA: dihydropteroate synthase [Gammaproteobacteria bacterium]|nr:dihydropteroate synthase [Gammaproteobacteria bacterium]